MMKLKKLHYLSLLGIVVAILGFSFGYIVYRDKVREVPLSLADYVLPESLEALVSDSDLVVVATMEGIEAYNPSFYGYGTEASELAGLDKAHQDVSFGTPVVDFRLDIVDTLKNDEQLRGQSVVVRLFMDLDSAEKSYQVGDQHVWFLGRNPDGTYGIWTPVGQATVTGETVKFPDQLFMGNKFEYSDNLQAFSAEIKTLTTNQ